MCAEYKYKVNQIPQKSLNPVKLYPGLYNGGTEWTLYEYEV